jgi:hypothetical protein
VHTEKSSTGSNEWAAQRPPLISFETCCRASTCAIILHFANAFNSISRAKVWQTLLQHDCLGSMLKAFYTQYAEPNELLVYDRNRLAHKVLSTEGVRQGDPFARWPSR